MKKYFLIVLLSVICGQLSLAQQDVQYRRNSLYSILINHTNDKFAKEIYNQFMYIPVPDKYNDHNLSILAISTKGKVSDKDVESFIRNNQIASRMVAKWFNRDITTGECDIDLIAARGLYNASELDKEFAKGTTRGMSMITDAGEDLIQNTFLVVNDVTYVDKNERAQAAGTALRILGTIGYIASGGNSDLLDISDDVASITETLKGFRVKVTSRLYQLVWDEETASDFYNNYWINKGDGDTRSAKDKVDRFEANRNKFKLVYIGSVKSKGKTTSFLGINEQQPYLMIRKACARAIDDNIVDLQHKFEQFRVKSPIYTVYPTITVGIGLKEGISESSKFEVLVPEIKNGKTSYKRVATIRPLPDKIWDNRFMSEEEESTNAKLGATTFEKISGGEILPGMLIRELF